MEKEVVTENLIKSVPNIIESLGESPLPSVHGCKIAQKRALVKEKFQRVSGKISQVLALSINLDHEEIVTNNEHYLEELKIENKRLKGEVKDYHTLLEQLKTQYEMTESRALKQQILTLTPSSWSRKKVAEFFDTSE